MGTLAMKFGWRRVAPPAASGPASWMLAATLAGGATAAMAQLHAVAPPAEQAETTALVARMAVAPSGGRRTLIDALIAGLKADGVWDRLDWLVVPAAHDAQAARLNWKPGSKALSTVNAPVFTTDRGHAGDGSSAYLDFGELPSAAGNQFALNDAAAFVWVNQTNGTGNVPQLGMAGGTSRLIISTHTAGGEFSGVNNGSVNTRTGSGSRNGARYLVREGAAIFRAYYNPTSATPTTDLTTASTILSSGSTMALHRNATTYSPDRIAAAGTGAALSGAQVLALHGRLNTYLTAIGAS